MNEPIRVRARLKNGLTEVTLLLLHPMETGLRVGASGSSVPAHYITEVNVWAGERKVLGARLSIAVAKDPLMTFRFHGGAIGEPVRVMWLDNLGEHASGQTVTT